MVASYRLAPDRLDPREQERAHIAARAGAEHKLVAVLPTVPRRPGARLFLRLDQTYVQLREQNNKASMARCIDGARAAAHLRGKEMVSMEVRSENGIPMSSVQNGPVITTANVWARELVIDGKPVRQLLVPASALDVAEAGGERHPAERARR